jgi:hypothetical protein
MTDFNASDRDVDRVIRSWLCEDRLEDSSRVAGAVLDEAVTIPQRRARGWPAWRFLVRNKVVPIGGVGIVHRATSRAVGCVSARIAERSCRVA